MNLDDVLARLTGLPGPEQAELRRLAGEVSPLWVPNPGPQTEAVLSAADVLLYGGAGGGGKSDCELGLAFTEHRRSLIVRRQYSNLAGMLDRAIEINGTRDGVSRSPPPRIITKDGRVIDFGAANNLGDEQAWQGQPHDLFCADEAAQFLEVQIRFFLGWLRSTEPGQRCRALLGSNPPLSAEGDWLIKMFRPWLDLTHPKPAKPGELRWFVTAPDGTDLEVDGPTPVEIAGRSLIPMSRTFIPAKMADNPYLVGTGYDAKLDALPEPLRSAVRDGNFMAARADQAFQVIPSQWVFEAQARWSEKRPEHAPMSCIAVDVAQGGIDQTVLAARYDAWFAPLDALPGASTPDGPSVAGLVLSRRRNGSTVVVDCGGGYGGSASDHLKSNGIEVTRYVGANASEQRTRDGAGLRFTNRRSEAWWRMREALDPSQDGGSPVALPPDAELVADLVAPTFEVTPSGLKVEPKDHLVKRLGRSPDRGDAVVMCNWAGPRHLTHGTEWRDYRAQHVTARPRVVLPYANRRR